MQIERPKSRQPMPPDAECVFRGVIFDVYQWQQKMFDGGTATFEKLKRSDTVVVVPVTEDKRIIILEEEQPGWDLALTFPKGTLEPGEDPVEGAKRELLEETGYAPGGELVLWEATQPNGMIDWAVYVFIARGSRKVAEPHPDNGEKIELKLTTFDDLLAMAGDARFSREMALKLLQAGQNPAELEKIKGLFGL